MSLEEFGYKEQLNRVLTTKDLVILRLDLHGADRPLRCIRLRLERSQGMVPLAYLVGLIGMFFTALSYAAMSRAFPLADPYTRTRSADCTKSPVSSRAGSSCSTIFWCLRCSI